MGMSVNFCVKVFNVKFFWGAFKKIAQIPFGNEINLTDTPWMIHPPLFMDSNYYNLMILIRV